MEEVKNPFSSSQGLNLIVVLSLSAFAIVLFYLTAESSSAQVSSNINNFADEPTSKVDFDAFEKLTKEVKEYRKGRLLNLETYLKIAKEKGVIILDTRSEAMFKAKHVKGAINLNFSDFTQDNLARVIPSF